MSLLIKNGRIVSSRGVLPGDVYIEGERVSAVGTGLTVAADRVIDASGKFVIPGGIDVHTHLDLPVGTTSSSDDFFTGTRAAAFGGTTTIIDFPTQLPGQSLHVPLKAWNERAKRSTIDYGFHMIVVDLPEERLHELDEMADAGITSFKVFTAYPDRLMIGDGPILRLMQRARDIGALVMVHAENGGAIELLVRQALAAGRTEPINHALTRPPITEGEATHRTIALAQIADAPIYIVHVSCSDALEQISVARAKGWKVYGETCPHYLFCSIDDLARPDFEGAKYVLSPPLRERNHQPALWHGLQANDLQVISTDHCPFFFATQKSAGKGNFTKIPNGGPGIEHRLQLLYHHGVNSGRITVERWVDMISTAPAKLFGLYPRKGTIAPGSDADIVIWDPAAEHTISAASHHMNVDYSLFEGMQVRGNAETVLSRGEIIVDRGTWLGTEGRGRFLKRDRFTPPTEEPLA